MQATHALALGAAILVGAVQAQQAPEGADHAGHHGPAAAASAAATTAAAPQSQGEVRRVDLAQGKVTLRHGPIVNLDMPPMTMVFTAVDPKVLEGLKQGDKVRFTADRRNGTYVVTAIERIE